VETEETLARKLTRGVYYDCVKEEPEIVKQIGKQFGKYAAVATRNCVHEILSE